MNTSRRSLDNDPIRESIHQDENLREDEQRDHILAQQNIDDFLLKGDVGALDLLADFVRERKKCSSMLERFDLLMQNQDYRRIVSNVELGMTTSADSIDALDNLKTEYHDFLSQLQARGDADTELDREDSERYFVPRNTRIPSEYIVIKRLRQLTLGRVVTSSVVSGFEINKQMVFDMPIGMYKILTRNDPFVKEEATAEAIERQIDANNRHIYPIRTSYSAMTRRAVE